MAIHHSTPPLGGGERPRLPSAQEARFFRSLENSQPLAASNSGGPVTQAIRTMRAAEVLSQVAKKPGHMPHGGAADPFEADPELRAIRETAERMIADSRAARFRAIQSLRRANAALRSARATLMVGGRA